MPINLIANDFNIEIGAHNLLVPQVNSNTLGINSTFFKKGTLFNEIKYNTSLCLLIDRDTDKLDKDHIPIWAKWKTKAEKDIFQFSKNFYVVADDSYDGKMNTVSSIELQNLLYGGLNFKFVQNNFSFNNGIYAGIYNLEIDDDLPRENLFDRSELTLTKFSFKHKIEFNYQFNKNTNIKFHNSLFFIDNSIFEKEFGFNIKKEFGDKFFKLEYISNTYDLDSQYKIKNGKSILPFNRDVTFNLSIGFKY